MSLSVLINNGVTIGYDVIGMASLKFLNYVTLSSIKVWACL